MTENQVTPKTPRHRGTPHVAAKWMSPVARRRWPGKENSQPKEITTTPTTRTTMTTTTPNDCHFHGSSHNQTPRLHFPTPPSKVLRTHLAQLSLTPHRTHLPSGAVRVDPLSGRHTTSHSTTFQQQQQQRVGYDGTNQTPSRELLQSTASSRSHRVPFSFSSSPERCSPFKDGSTSSGSTSCCMEMIRNGIEDLITERIGCCDPVAWTLLHTNDEMEEDFPQGSMIRKVSSSLLDVMDDTNVANLIRPTPLVARPRSYYV